MNIKKAQETVSFLEHKYAELFLEGADRDALTEVWSLIRLHRLVLSEGQGRQLWEVSQSNSSILIA